VLLASATVNVDTAPRRLCLASQGATHTVYFNGAQMTSHTASGTVYSSGQPGIAASVFGGPKPSNCQTIFCLWEDSSAMSGIGIQ
jgi:hypothetical protein